MEKSAVLETIKREKLVPVVRTNNTEDARKAVEILASCGIKIFEITMTVPNAAELIRELSASDSGVTLGAGTVLTPNKPKSALKPERVSSSVRLLMPIQSTFAVTTKSL